MTTSLFVTLVMANYGRHGSNIIVSCGFVKKGPTFSERSAWRSQHYRGEESPCHPDVLKERLDDIQNTKELHEQQGRNVIRMNRAERHLSHMLDVARICVTSYEKILHEAIAWCCARPKIFFLGQGRPRAGIWYDKAGKDGGRHCIVVSF